MDRRVPTLSWRRGDGPGGNEGVRRGSSDKHAVRRSLHTANGRVRGDVTLFTEDTDGGVAKRGRRLMVLHLRNRERHAIVNHRCKFRSSTAPWSRLTKTTSGALFTFSTNLAVLTTPIWSFVLIYDVVILFLPSFPPLTDAAAPSTPPRAPHLAITLIAENELERRLGSPCPHLSPLCLATRTVGDAAACCGVEEEDDQDGLEREAWEGGLEEREGAVPGRVYRRSRSGGSKAWRSDGVTPRGGARRGGRSEEARRRRRGVRLSEAPQDNFPGVFIPKVGSTVRCGAEASLATLRN
ncbi:hypothetical protein O3P69_005825 [Scylla paramamosain]|uniref:Uncharacterized protein n=1 Tax=Scylla paramamosain TaxID=85552 RepID=A0AAW0U4H7_SCYPA